MAYTSSGHPPETSAPFFIMTRDVPGRFRTAYAIYVGETATAPAYYVDTLPVGLADCALSLQAFAAGGLISTATLAAHGHADAAIGRLFADRNLGYIMAHFIMAHFAAYGCLAARIERLGEDA
jgi:hypothetical protein